jgi:hypothetical protein
MSAALTYTCHGLEELETLLENFPAKLGTKVIRQALADAARLGKAALKDEARKHDDRGEIRVNLRTLKRRVRHLSDTPILVQRNYYGAQFVTVGFAWPEGAAGWLVEFGHRMVTHGTVARLTNGKAPKARNLGLTGQGRVVGMVKPHPIAAPAFEQARGGMEDAFTSRVLREAETAMQ